MERPVSHCPRRFFAQRYRVPLFVVLPVRSRCLNTEMPLVKNKVVRVLLAGGGDVNHVDGAGRSPAMAAALRGNRSLLKFLSENGADLSMRNSDGRTASFFAAMNAHVNCLAFILDSSDDYGAVSATADAKDKIGCTPLWTAAAHGHLETLQYLVRRGASPNACDVTGTTAAWMTAGSGSTQCLNALLEAGADGNLANEDGITPVLIAAQEGHAGCLRVLAAAGADLGIRDLAGNSAAALAAMGGHLSCLQVGRFIQTGRLPRCRGCVCCRTKSGVACQCARFLLQKSCDFKWQLVR